MCTQALKLPTGSVLVHKETRQIRSAPPSVTRLWEAHRVTSHCWTQGRPRTKRRREQQTIEFHKTAIDRSKDHSPTIIFCFRLLATKKQNEKLKKKERSRQKSPAKKSSCIVEEQLICLFRHILFIVDFVPNLNSSLLRCAASHMTIGETRQESKQLQIKSKKTQAC